MTQGTERMPLVRWSAVVATLLVASSCGGGAAPSVTGGHGSGRRSREWVLVTIHSARIAEQLDGGTTWDPDAASAAAERRRDDGQAIGALIGIVNPGP